MARNTRGGYRTRSYTKRGTFWGRFGDNDAVGLAATTAVLHSTAVPVVEGETVVRTRGQIHVASDQMVASETPTGAIGMLIASDPAVAVGVGSLPTPITDLDSELWFMHQFFAAGIVFDTGIGFQTPRFEVFQFDSKAMRKFESGQTLCVIIENGSTVGMTFVLQFAVLFKVA